MCENLQYEFALYFKELTQKPGLQQPTKYRARAAVVSAITKRLYFPLSRVCEIKRSYFKLLLLLLLLLPKENIS